MTTTILMQPTYFECGAGKFKQTSRYLRAGVSGALFPIPKGKTLDIDLQTLSGPNIFGSIYQIRYSVNGYVAQTTTAYGGSVTQGIASGSFNATATLVKF